MSLTRRVSVLLSIHLQEIIDGYVRRCAEDYRCRGAAGEEIGQPTNIAVADGGGNLVTDVRMDNAWIGSVDIAINKAFTARAFDISTADLARLSQSGNPFFGIHASNHGRVMIT